VSLAITAVRVLAISRAVFRYLERYAHAPRDAAHPHEPASGSILMIEPRAGALGPTTAATCHAIVATSTR
jgi:hypothetical protein